MKVFIQLIFLTLAAVIYVSESTYIRVPEGPREFFREAPKRLINICSIQDKTLLIKCHCDNPKAGAASRAYCWIIGNLLKDNLVWENFMSQPNLETVLISAITEPGLTHLPTDLIRNATKLRNLEIQFGCIKQLHPYAFANSASLQQLSIANNKLVALEPNAFSHLTSLANLTISNNNLTEIKRAVFHDLPNLERIKLSNNRITTLHAGCFKHLNKLTHLNLNSNSLSALSRGNFEGLTNILRLNIKRNHLTYIGDFTFVDLWTLEELFLDDNQISFVSDKGLSGLPMLKTLSLAGNELTVLGDATFTELKRVNFIDLKNNHLTELNEETFKPILNNLRSMEFVLKLYDNNLTCDCSMNWLKSLRNETRSFSVQTSLDALLCSTDTPILYVPQPTHFMQKDVTRSQFIVQDDYDYEEQVTEVPVPKKKLNSQKNLVEFLTIPAKYLPCKKRVQSSKSTMDIRSIYSKGNINAHLTGFPVAISIANMLLKV